MALSHSQTPRHMASVTFNNVTVSDPESEKLLQQPQLLPHMAGVVRWQIGDPGDGANLTLIFALRHAHYLHEFYIQHSVLANPCCLSN